jgi:hypothetical protein
VRQHGHATNPSAADRGDSGGARPPFWPASVRCTNCRPRPTAESEISILRAGTGGWAGSPCLGLLELLLVPMGVRGLSRGLPADVSLQARRGEGRQWTSDSKTVLLGGGLASASTAAAMSDTTLRYRWHPVAAATSDPALRCR